jgi:hypothetical protein
MFPAAHAEQAGMLVPSTMPGILPQYDVEAIKSETRHGDMLGTSWHGTRQRLLVVMATTGQQAER